MGFSGDLLVEIANPESSRDRPNPVYFRLIRPRKLEDKGIDDTSGKQSVQYWKKKRFEVVAALGVPGDEEDFLQFIYGFNCPSVL